MNSFQLFINQVQAAPDLLKVRVLKIVFDILMVHESEFLGRPGDTVSTTILDLFIKALKLSLVGSKGERIVEFLLHVLENEELEEAQAVVCVGISKLMLSGMVSDERVRSFLDCN